MNDRIKKLEAENARLRKALDNMQPVAWISDSPTKGNGMMLHWTKESAYRWATKIIPLYRKPYLTEGVFDEWT